ncbi:MAG: DUF2147 domain-containing protein [Alphaproteobacteria bacterium]|nr:DUF2147 domain-containing protein [Alphaproteobacteria bacterium]
MFKKILISTIMAAAPMAAVFATAEPAPVKAPIAGFWRTLDDKTGMPKSIVRLYECGDRLCGRIVALFDGENISETYAAPVKVAEKVKGKPHIAGLDIIWDMRWDGKEFVGGKIMDPQSGSVYSAVIWQTKEDYDFNQLRVRGKLGPFGRTQVWDAILPNRLPAELGNTDVSNWKPIIVK